MKTPVKGPFGELK